MSIDLNITFNIFKSLWIFEILISKSSVTSNHLLRTRAIGMLEAGKRHGDVAKALGKATQT